MKARSSVLLVLSAVTCGACLAYAAPAVAADLPPLPTGAAAAANAPPPAAAPATAPDAQPADAQPGDAEPAPVPAPRRRPAAQPPRTAPRPEAPVVAPQPVAAQPAVRDEAPSAPAFSGDPNKMWFVSGSVRESFIGTHGYNPWSTSDLLSQWTFAGSRTLISRGHFSFAGGASWDIGGSSATSRGVDAGILANRFSATLEGRWHPRTFVYGFVRLAPGANIVTARLNDPSAPATLTTTEASFAGDASIGAAITPMVSPGAPRVWFTPEVGYGYGTSMPMRLSPKNPSDITGTPSRTDLGELALSGVFFRIGLAMSF